MGQLSRKPSVRGQSRLTTWSCEAGMLGNRSAGVPHLIPISA
jgi:hypothetical protein